LSAVFGRRAALAPFRIGTQICSIVFSSRVIKLRTTAQVIAHSSRQCPAASKFDSFQHHVVLLYGFSPIFSVVLLARRRPSLRQFAHTCSCASSRIHVVAHRFCAWPTHGLHTVLRVCVCVRFACVEDTFMQVCVWPPSQEYEHNKKWVAMARSPSHVSLCAPRRARRCLNNLEL
jgi:hypothetical protein